VRLARYVADTMGQAIQPLVAGPLADAIGRRRPMLVAHVMFLTASACCALAPSINVLILARVFQALGGCTFLIVGQAQVGDVFPRDELSEALAFFSLSRMFAAMVGPLAGGLLCELFGWRSSSV
jgi:DHA1 family bicyclomycin/chloramphenicol resistance-like MFS transporter